MPDLKEVLADVGKLLKAMTATSMKRFTVKDMERSHGPSIRSLIAEEDGDMMQDVQTSSTTSSRAEQIQTSGECEVEEESEVKMVDLADRLIVAPVMP